MKLGKRLKQFFFPHKGNRYHPGLFARETISVLAFALLLIEGAYLLQVHVFLKNEGFLATVLPAALTTLANADRAAEGLPALERDPALDRVAQAKADDMAAKGYFAHVSPDGTTPWDWLERAGYEYSYAGENLAEDFTESEDVEAAWMHSPMHRANILKQEYTRVGIGVAQGMYEGREVTFVAQFFATPPEDLAAADAPQVESPSTDIAQAPAEQPVETAQPSPSVLAAEATPEEAGGSQIAVTATSPSSAMWYVVMIFTAFVAFFFALTLIVHSRKRLIRLEALGGGVALIGLAMLLLLYNAPTGSVHLPDGGQAASVVQAL